MAGERIERAAYSVRDLMRAHSDAITEILAAERQAGWSDGYAAGIKEARNKQPPRVTHDAKTVYSVLEMIHEFGVGKTKLYKEIKQGRLVARKLGVKTIFFAEDVEAWKNTLPAPSRNAMGDETGEDSGSYENRLLKSLSE